MASTGDIIDVLLEMVGIDDIIAALFKTGRNGDMPPVLFKINATVNILEHEFQKSSVFFQMLAVLLKMGGTGDMLVV
jgi:hypothetical protein